MINKSETPEYDAWYGMITRCTKPNCRSYPYYGGRGIKVCDRWLKFENFLADMGRRPGNGYSLDRKNNDGNYEPGNCRWATKTEQNRNRRYASRPNPTGVTKVKQRFLAQIGVDGKNIYLGTHATFEAANAAYRAARIKYGRPLP